MNLEEAVETLRGSFGYLASHHMTHVSDSAVTVLDALREAQEEAAQCDSWRDRYTAVSVAMGDREGEVWKSTHDLPERVAAQRQEVARLKAEVERLTRERDQLEGQVNRAAVMLNNAEPTILEEALEYVLSDYALTRQRITALEAALDRIEKRHAPLMLGHRPYLDMAGREWCESYGCPMPCNEGKAIREERAKVKP